MIRLYNIIESFLDQPFKIHDLLALDNVYISSRYPSDIGMIATGKPTQQEAEEFYVCAKNIFEAIIKLID